MPLDVKAFEFLTASSGLKWATKTDQTAVYTELVRLRSDCSTLPTPLMLLVRTTPFPCFAARRLRCGAVWCAII